MPEGVINCQELFIALFLKNKPSKILLKLTPLLLIVYWLFALSLSLNPLLLCLLLVVNLLRKHKTEALIQGCHISLSPNNCERKGQYRISLLCSPSGAEIKKIIIIKNP